MLVDVFFLRAFLIQMDKQIVLYKNYKKKEVVLYELSYDDKDLLSMYMSDHRSCTYIFLLHHDDSSYARIDIVNLQKLFGI